MTMVAHLLVDNAKGNLIIIHNNGIYFPETKGEKVQYSE